MAEAIVSLAVEGITDLLIHKTKFLCDVSGEVERLRDELKRMQCFLKDAELRQEQDERVRNWVAEIRDTAYDVEDVVEMYVFKVALLAHGKGFHGFCNRFTSIFIKPFHLRKIGKQIKAIHSKIGDISSSLQTYGIRFDGDRRGGYSFESGMQRNMRRSFPHVEEEDVINLEDCTKDVLSQLMAEQTRFRIVSIVGMGGIGKTTLAKQVYNHVDVKRHFDCHAWVFISQQYSVRDVLSSLLAKVESSSFDKMSEEQLVERLFNVLKRRRYLVVLDDIWRKETWDNLRSAFPNGKPGSKILLTTRNKEVASYADPWSSQIEPPFLTMEEGWDLLCKKAFPRDIVGEHTCQPEFQNLGRKMVKKCGGLPLAIVLLGGLLATKKSLNDWKVVLKNINLHFNKYRQQDQHYGGVHGILALSYNDLPFHLKPCFLYLGHFPEDSEISKKELIWLWMAEGFITSQRGEREEMMEDLAEEYLEELINRCLVQVGKMDHTGNGVKTCRIHDLLRDLCVSKAEQENFLDIIHLPMNENSNSLSLAKTTPNARRIAVHPGECHDRYVYLEQGHSKLHSLLVFYNEETRRLDIPKRNGFRLLRVLNLLRSDGSWNVPIEIGNLIHLRYLGLQAHAIFLPTSIGNLTGLQTLYVHGESLMRIPNVLFRLKHMRHLMLISASRVAERTFRVDTLSNIETLKYIEAKYLVRNDAMLKLTNVRNLGVIFDRSAEVEEILRSPVCKLDRLRSLYMKLHQSIPFPDLEPLSQCHHLSKLCLDGELPGDLHRSQHVLLFLPTNITKLTLQNSDLKQDPMVVLEKLSHLRILKLGSRSYMGTKMICSANGFPQLNHLEMEQLTVLRDWQIEEGSMPCLKSLHLLEIGNLRSLPLGLRYLTTLQELQLYGMNMSLVERIQVDEYDPTMVGEDFHIVRHIPSISLW